MTPFFHLFGKFSTKEQYKNAQAMQQVSCNDNNLLTSEENAMEFTNLL